MTAACMKHGYLSLVGGHAYTILGTQELKVDGKVKHQLIKMRNPWGKERYDGPWSDNDKNWTDDFKKQAHLKVANDGIFFLTLKDFKVAFTVYNIAQYSTYKSISTATVKGTGKKFFRKFTSSVDQEIVLAVDY